VFTEFGHDDATMNIPEECREHWLPITFPALGEMIIADSSSTRILDDVMFMPFRQSRITDDTNREPIKI
jgi:hypothetical protein